MRIRMLGPGHAEVLLHGIDIANDIAGFQLNAAAGGSGVPELMLVLNGRQSCGVEYEGLARVVIGEAPDPGPAAAAFLSAIDPKLLEQAALNRPDLGTGPHDLTKAMLVQLTEWANGRP